VERKRDRTTMKKGVCVWNEEVGRPSNYVDSTLFNCYHPIHAAGDKRVITRGITKVYEITDFVRLPFWVFVQHDQHLLR
jgi:hypothetical protein